MTSTENRKLDMSLDDIIREDGIKGGRRGGFRSSGGGGQNNFGNRRRFGGGGGGGGGQMGGDRRRYEPKRLNNGGQFQRNRNQPYGQSSGRFGNSGGGGGGGGGAGGRNRQMNGFNNGGGGGGGNRRSASLHVSNLAPSVNTEDVDELFSTFGVLVRSYVHYDQHGTSLGTAEVVFEQRSDAIEARNKLNSVPLDGKPLRITMTDEDDGPNDPFSSYLRSSQQPRSNGPNRSNNNNYRDNNNRNSNNQNRDRNRNGGGGGSGGGGRDNSRSEGRSGRNGPQKSAEDLDREMDEWRMNVDDDTNGDI